MNATRLLPRLNSLTWHTKTALPLFPPGLHRSHSTRVATHHAPATSTQTINTTKPHSCCSTAAADRTVASHAGTNSSSESDRLAAALAQNKEWAAKIAKEDPELFPRLANGQHPEILWIGCSDSRCPETTVLGLKPGEVFVHRNIANILHPGDLSSSAVVEYAVRHLRVKHIVVCGHTCCGGVNAALGNKQLGILDPWLMPLRRLREANLKDLQASQDPSLKLVELNVLDGIRTLKEKSVVLDAMEERGLEVHGLVFEVASGVLRILETGESGEAVKARLTSFKTEP